jgi:dihydroorotate dehydrogenase
VVGVGGIDSVAGARRMVDAGAAALGVGTAAMLDDGVLPAIAAVLRGGGPPSERLAAPAGTIA